MKIWDVATGSERMTLTGHTAPVSGCAVSPGGSFSVSASSDKTLKIWDVATGSERTTLTGHSGSVQGCAVSPGGSFVVSASSDKTLKIWDVATGTELADLVLPGGATAVAAHPSRPIIAGGDEGGGVQMALVIGIEYGPLIVTAVDLGSGLEIRCPHCSRAIPWNEEYRDQEMACPLEDCSGMLRVNPFVVEPIVFEPAKLSREETIEATSEGASEDAPSLEGILHELKNRGVGEPTPRKRSRWDRGRN